MLCVLLCVPAIAQHPHHHPKPPKVVVAPPAPKHYWEVLGSKKVDITADVDHVLVTAYEGAFTKVKFHVEKAPIHVKAMTIVYANGESQRFSIDTDFAIDASSKTFDLPGNKRIIQQIKFEYKTIDNGNGKAKMVVFGKH